ncbi:MAG: hypothetical protein P0116_07020 [Candidatus Nitrosocosmicus sp.]|nr:hypothetical protein [Candidatus Nitrosocosmicus sp.]
MLSKAEIQYLQGQKQVSKSYERKLRCLIRKKVEVLQKELPLLSSIFAGNIKSVFSEILNEKDGSRLASGQENIIKDFQYSINKNSATEFSNVSLSCDEIDKDHVVARGRPGSKDSSNDIQISKAEIR